MTPERIRPTLDSIDGWKRFCRPFLFIFGGPKKSFAKWSSGENKGVHANHLLAQLEHDGDSYAIYGFCNHRDLSENELANLRVAAAAVDLGTVRAESLSYSGLEPWRAWRGDGELTHDDDSITMLGSSENGIFVYPVADGVPHPVVIYARHENKHCIFLIPQKLL